MAEFIGKDGIHHITGTCELCGGACDPAAEELNCLSCTFQQCDSGVYHQDCLEKFLKRTGCEKNRKTGFQCPRGRGKLKGEPCPGRIDKSHPIHPRKEEKKKTKAPEPVQPAKKFGPAAKEARRKEKEERDKQKVAQAQKEEERLRQLEKQAACAPADEARDQVALCSLAKKAKNAAADTQRTKALVESIRREMGNGSGTVEAAPPPPPARELLTLDDYEASRGSSQATTHGQSQRSAPSANVWGAKAPALDQDLQSTEAFPAMPGVKARQNGAPPAAPPQRTWKASLSGSEKPEPPNPTANYTTLGARPPPPPPPPARSEMSREDSVASIPRGPPGLFTGRNASMRVSQHSSDAASQHSNDASSFTSSFHTGVTGDTPALAHGSAVSSRIGVLEEGVAAAAAEPKLTKAQKKNMKRAGKKARQLPVDGSESSGPADEAALAQQCMASIAHFKAMCFLQGLMAMGFDHWLCMAAIRRMGIDGNAATGWILDRQSEEFSGAKRSWAADAVTYSGPAMQVDVSFEMEMVERACTALPVGVVTVQDVLGAVVHSQGNVQQALASVLEQVRQFECSSWPDAHVGTASALAVLNES